jgi:hypothetical protein
MRSTASPPSFGRPPVFLSASVPLPDRHPRYFDSSDPIAIRDAVKALATAVLPTTGIVFGGHPAITPLISEVAERLRHVTGQVVLYQSAWFITGVPQHRGIQHIVVVAAAATRARSLMRMRTEMIRSYPLFTAGFFVGGMEGVEAEYDRFRRAHPMTDVFPVASTGAAAELIWRNRPAPAGGWAMGLSDDPSYLSLFHRLLGF